MTAADQEPTQEICDWCQTTQRPVFEFYALRRGYNLTLCENCYQIIKSKGQTLLYQMETETNYQTGIIQ